MAQNAGIDWGTVGWFLLGAMAISLALAFTLIALTYRSLRNLHVPQGADFFTTLRSVPITVVIILDLLDFGLDIFSAPFTWILLGQLGLHSLRTITVLEGLLPGTGVIPTMTLAWILARLGFRLPTPSEPLDTRRYGS